MGKPEAPTDIGKCPACGIDNIPLRSVGGVMVCEKCSLRRFSTKVRKRIQEAFERQAEMKRREAWKKRLDVARKGVALYQLGKFAQALNVFEDYIHILETRHATGPGGLHLGNFDKEKDAAELLLIAGVYWDMAKIYDRMKGQTAQMRSALTKFIEFSIERPHVVLASEAIRKHLETGGAVHVEDFRRALEIVSKHLSRCFIATAVFGPTSVEVQNLRAFRDRFLIKTMPGRALIRAYYLISPPIARALSARPALARVARPPLRALARLARFLHKD